MAAHEVEKRQIKPLGKVTAWAQTGVEPKLMGLGPISAVKAVVSCRLYFYRIYILT